MILHELISYDVLRLIWWLLLGVLLVGFAVTDGFDPGAMGLLRATAKTDVLLSMGGANEDYEFELKGDNGTAVKINFSVGPMSGAAVQDLVASASKLSPAVIDKIAAAFVAPPAK